MHIAIGYRWFPTAAGGHLETALRGLGHTVTYVGLPTPDRAGYDSTVPVPALLRTLRPAVDLYLWVDPAGRYFPPGLEAAPAPTACYLIDVHLGHWREQAARFFDYVFIAQHDYVPRFRAATGRDNVAWLPLAAAPEVHRPHPELPKRYDVGFVGNLALAHRGTARARRLALLAWHFTLNDYTRAYTPAEVGEVYSQSRLVFNTSIAGDVTMRLFEGAASGALVLTDAAANGLETLFTVGEELAVYRDDADLVAQVRHFLAHPEARERMALAGHRRVLAEHTYAHRMQRLVARVTDPAQPRTAALRQAAPAEIAAARQKVLTHLHMLDSLFDEARAAGHGPWRRWRATAPAWLRRLLR